MLMHHADAGFCTPGKDLDFLICSDMSLEQRAQHLPRLGEAHEPAWAPEGRNVPNKREAGGLIERCPQLDLW